MAVTERTTETRFPSTLDVIPALIAAMRPKQWTKNLFVFVALLFTLTEASMHTFAIAAAAFGLFCLISGAVYLLNDVLDREQDRLHPEKRKRPIASGRLPVGVAIAASFLFGIGGAAAGFLINFKFGAVSVAYLVLQIAYCLHIKHLVLLDVFAIAGGFVFRTVAGAWAIAVPNSQWLLVCTLQLALFLGFGKRRHELVSLAEDAQSHRRNLAHYSVPLLDQLSSIVLGGLIVSYAVYAIMSPTAVKHPLLVVTLPCVMYGVFRYLYLIHVEHKGGSPETILMEDRPMQFNLLLWVVIVVAAFKLSGIH